MSINPLEETRTRYSPLRKIIKEKMSESALIPQFNLEIEVRTKLMAEIRQKLDPRPSFTSCLLWALSRALESHPELNGFCYEQEIGGVSEINPGVAIAGPKGLLVPVIRKANEKTLGQFHEALTDLVQRAAANKLTADDFYGGTFTLSNLGMYQIKRFTPLLNPPQIAIMGAGAPQTGFERKNEQMEEYSFIHISVSADHRAVDGTDAARFLNRFKQICESDFT